MHRRVKKTDELDRLLCFTNNILSEGGEQVRNSAESFIGHQVQMPDEILLNRLTKAILKGIFQSISEYLVQLLVSVIMAPGELLLSTCFKIYDA